MSQFAQKNNFFFSKIPHEIVNHWCGSRPSFLKIVNLLSNHVNERGEVHFSARKLANQTGIHVSNVSRFLNKGRSMGLWLYEFDNQKNLSFLKFVGGIFANVYVQAQHLVKTVKRSFDRVFPKRSNPIKINATPTQHQTQHASDPDKREKNKNLMERIRELSIAKAMANATPNATQINT